MNAIFPITAAPPTLDDIGAALAAIMPTGCHSISAHYYSRDGAPGFYLVNLHHSGTPNNCVGGDGDTLQRAFDKASARLTAELDRSNASGAEAEFGMHFAPRVTL